MALFARVRTGAASPHPRYKDVLDAALRLGAVASSSVAPSEALQRMVNEAIDLLEADRGSIMLTEDDGLSLVLVAASGLPSQVAVGTRLPLGESVAGRVIATGKPLLLSDVQPDIFVNFVPKARPISSSVVVPLRARGRAIGVLNLSIAEPSRIFGGEDLRIAQMFADHAATLIYMARLHEQAEQRSSDLTALVESSKGLLGELDMRGLLQQALDGGCRLMAARDGFACLFESESGAIDSGVFRGVEKEVIREVLERPEVHDAIQRANVIVVESGDTTFAVAGFLTGRATKGALVIVTDPTLVHDRLHLLGGFVHQTGLALGTAEMYSLVERRENELAAIAHSIPNPIVLADARGRIVTANHSAEELFNVSAQFLAGQQVHGNLGNDTIETLLLSEGTLQSEVFVGAPPRTYRVRVTDVSTPGTMMGRVLIMDDVSAERDIAQTQRDFVAMIGHELRTPLTIIKGFARTLKRRADRASADDVQEAFALIDAKAEHLGRLIDDLLYVSRIESREASLTIDTVDVRALIVQIAEDLTGEHEDREVQIDASDELLWQCDEAKLALLLRHLIQNGLKYSQAPDPVVVRVGINDNEMRVDVVDAGIGIVSTDIPGIFDRFRQLDTSSTRQHGGTGVGLYLCAQLVRMHDGHIWVDSSWGKGSTFSFTLPNRAGGGRVTRVLGGAVQETG